MNSNNNITSLFTDWNEALQSGCADKVTALYESDAILLPTVSNQVRHNHDEIKDYFVNFLALKPVGQIDESNIRLLGELAIHSGVYTFTFKGNASAQARFTFVYRHNGTCWKIIEHHSSKMPEPL